MEEVAGQTRCFSDKESLMIEMSMVPYARSAPFVEAPGGVRVKAIFRLSILLDD